MSSNTSPILEGGSPFQTTTTPVIERANRLMGLRAHPGFADMVRISQELVQTTADQCADYPGWDPMQITVLKVRMQVAKEYHQLLLARINMAIEAGVEEARAFVSSLPAVSPDEAVDNGDRVRQKVLEQFENMEMRPAGSY